MKYWIKYSLASSRYHQYFPLCAEDRESAEKIAESYALAKLKTVDFEVVSEDAIPLSVIRDNIEYRKLDLQAYRQRIRNTIARIRLLEEMERRFLNNDK